MRRRRRAVVLATVVVLGLLLARESVRSGPATGGPAPLEKGWGRLLASGTVTAVDPPAGTVALAITGAGRLQAFQGGMVWLETAVTGTQLIHLLPATVVVNARGAPIPATAVRIRDSLTAWAVVRPDAAILAVSLAVAPAQASPVAALPSGAEPESEGVVLGRSGSMIEVLTSRGIQRSVVVTPATTVSSGGALVPLTSLSPYDVLKIDGPLNSDGSLVALRITVEFSAASAAQVAGSVEQSAPGLNGFVVEGTMIAASAGTYIIQNVARIVFASIPSGRPVAVYGTAIMAGTVPVALQARVIAVR